MGIYKSWSGGYRKKNGNRVSYRRGKRIERNRRGKILSID